MATPSGSDPSRYRRGTSSIRNTVGLPGSSSCTRRTAARLNDMTRARGSPPFAWARPEVAQHLRERVLHVAPVPGGVLRLDREPHGRRRLEHRREERLEREHRRAGLVRRRILVVDPGLVVAAVVVGGELLERHRADGAPAGARPVDPSVVHADERAVGREPHVALDRVGPLLDGLQVGGQGVLGLLVVGTAVGHDLDGRPTGHAGKRRAATRPRRDLRMTYSRHVDDDADGPSSSTSTGPSPTRLPASSTACATRSTRWASTIPTTRRSARSSARRWPSRSASTSRCRMPTSTWPSRSTARGTTTSACSRTRSTTASRSC